MRESSSFLFSLLAGFLSLVAACDGGHDGKLVRHVRRMQPDAMEALSSPKAPLEWGQLNVLHTTDTHGYLEGHLKEHNYGADWGDFSAFVAHMKRKARHLGVDLLLVDTGDLHDGAGLSDATAANGVNGEVSNIIFENIPYDLLTIGNHELYSDEVAFETADQFSKFYGERYLTSNAQIYRNDTGTAQWEYIGQRYRYFTTEHGVRILAFGVTFDFEKTQKHTRVVPAAEMAEETWFKLAIAQHDAIDLFVIIGHNPIRSKKDQDASTFGIIHRAIRNENPETPILIFGGHAHERDFAVYDDKTVAIASGRYCETLGWVSMNGVPGCATQNPPAQPTPSRPAQATPLPDYSRVILDSPSTANSSFSPSKSHYRYARRYLDWNRATMEYHSDMRDEIFNTSNGNNITEDIYEKRLQLNLTKVFGCAPQTYCMECAPETSPRSIFPLLLSAMRTIVVNETRKDIPRLMMLNSGSVRFDLVAGPVTVDDSWIVSPFDGGFRFLADVPYYIAREVLGHINRGPHLKRDVIYEPSFSLTMQAMEDVCVNPAAGSVESSDRHSKAVTAGYTTVDDFGDDGDDTIHSPIPLVRPSNAIQTEMAFPNNGQEPETVDLVFNEFMWEAIIKAMRDLDDGLYTASYNYTAQEAFPFYSPLEITTHTYLTSYVQKMWGNDTSCLR